MSLTRRVRILIATPQAKRHESNLRDVANYVAIRTSMSASDKYQLLVNRFRPHLWF